mgnify:CR=1 FL=1
MAHRESKIFSHILESDSGILHDERLAVPLQRLARAVVLPDQDLSHMPPPHDSCQAAR